MNNDILVGRSEGSDISLPVVFLGVPDVGCNSRGGNKETGRRGFKVGGTRGGGIRQNYRQETQSNNGPMQSMLNAWAVGGTRTWADQMEVNRAANNHAQQGVMRDASSQQANPIAYA